jgi:hypothetical protein
MWSGLTAITAFQPALIARLAHGLISCSSNLFTLTFEPLLSWWSWTGAARRPIGGTRALTWHSAFPQILSAHLCTVSQSHSVILTSFLGSVWCLLERALWSVWLGVVHMDVPGNKWPRAWPGRRRRRWSLMAMAAAAARASSMHGSMPNTTTFMSLLGSCFW